MDKKTASSGRLTPRLPRDVHALVKRAFKVRGRGVTIGESQIIRLSVKGQRQIADAILNPPKPTAALRRAFELRHELFGPGA